MARLRSDPAEMGLWRSEERRIYNDFVAAFGETPPPLTSVAVMPDTDNTGEEVITHCGDILLDTSE